MKKVFITLILIRCLISVQRLTTRHSTKYGKIKQQYLGICDYTSVQCKIRTK